ncbi:hypothetical protein BU15DRAFT_39557 [Melanogaster broomeanus]|nr:hypothetical protein BU15DRAFT_39557 [Melanogaster broomeanus]
MKRGGDPGVENDPKKLHTDSDSYDDFDESRKRCAKELPQLRNDDHGYIECKVFMTWPPRNKIHRLNLESVEDSGIYRFEAEFPHRDGIGFRPHERICLALKGARTEKRKESSAQHYLPVNLKYPDGVLLKYLSGVNEGKVINTWEGNVDEWYNPGTVQRVSDAVMNDASEAHSLRVPPPPRLEVADDHAKGMNLDRVPPPQISVTDNILPAQPQQQVQQQRGTSIGGPGRVVKETKSQKKRRKQKEKEMLLHGLPANSGDIPSPAEVTALGDVQPKPSAHSSSDNASHDKLPSTSRRTNEYSNGGVSLPTARRISPSSDEIPNYQAVVDKESSGPTPQVQAGVRTERGDIFTALKDLRKGHSMINIIGVVVLVNPAKKTRTDEWSCYFRMVDPSTVGAISEAIGVTCFQKKYLEWLPQVKEGDVVILRKLKINEFNGDLRATGFSDKLRWAVYDPATHGIRPPAKGNVPDKEILDDGLGYEFSPYWEPIKDSVELQYCCRIVEWWKTLQENRPQDVTTVQCSGPARKQHLLVSEASPDRPPKGFFDCTVEVLQKFDSNNEATTVYVTDYTSNPSVHAVQATWCPPELSDRILQCEMWDSAKDIARIMNPGEYWYLHNIRAKWNPSHYMEGTMQLAEKVAQLDEAKLEVQPHLRALLARKKEFEENRKSPAGSGSSHIFPHMLFQDVDENTSFFTCTAELLCVDFNSRGDPCIYVTDYTLNHMLPAAISMADWAQGLDHRVVRIKLDDAQIKNSQDLTTGSLYTIRNLRVGRGTTPGVYGRLGGEDRLIIPLQDLSSHHAQMLRRNKESWRREIELNGLSTTTLPEPTAHLDDSTIQQVLLSPTHPDTFRIVARAVDYFPFCLEDACVLRCTKCESK